MVRSDLVRYFGTSLVVLFAAFRVAPGSVMAADGFDPTKLPALFYLMVVGFGLTGGAFLSRRLGAASSGAGH
jgi:hypothetical protein